MCSIGGVEKRQFAVINEDKKKKSSYKNSGMLMVKDFRVEKHASFLDYIQVRASRRGILQVLHDIE